MQELILIVIRHALALCGGWFAAHSIDGSTTVGIVVGLIFLLIPVIWSTVAKWLHLDEKLADGITTSQQWRVMAGTLVSQGVTALAAWLAVDANHPELLLAALVNVGLSKAGVHQALFNVSPQSAVKLLLLGGLLSLSSCATTAAFLASPFGQATLQTADQLAKQVLVTTEESGLAQIILQTSAKVAALNAQGVDPDPVKETLRISEIAGFDSVLNLAQSKYQALTGKPFALPKNPVNVLPAVAAARPKPKLHFTPVRRPAADDVPGCMQLADRIPLYGDSVALMLSTGSVR